MWVLRVLTFTARSVVVLNDDGCDGWVAYFIACSLQQFRAYLAIRFIYLIIFSIDCYYGGGLVGAEVDCVNAHAR
ncbi:MAG: hypothetical protein F4215_02095 [Gemmatimonadetes bacterium]|nr:hypothetical protein [Gemmatimonadota bacterium]